MLEINIIYNLSLLNRDRLKHGRNLFNVTLESKETEKEKDKGIRSEKSTHVRVYLIIFQEIIYQFDRNQYNI